MSTEQNTTLKRFRLRFSLRTLVILVTLVCCYAACWGPTKKWGVPTVLSYVRRPVRIGPDGEEYVLSFLSTYAEPMTPLSFVVSVARYDDVLVDPDGGVVSLGSPTEREYISGSSATSPSCRMNGI